MVTSSCLPALGLWEHLQCHALCQCKFEKSQWQSLQCVRVSNSLQEVRRQLAPWEQQISEVQSRLAVAASERDMLRKSHTDAKQRLQVWQTLPCSNDN